QRDAAGAVGIIFDGDHLGGDPVELVPLEVDDPVHPLVAAAPVPDRDAAVDVAPSLPGEALQQGLLGPLAGQLLEGVTRHLADTRGSGLIVLDSHRVPSLQALEDLDAVAFLELDDRLLPVGTAP